jgi:hypothetical protein
LSQNLKGPAREAAAQRWHDGKPCTIPQMAAGLDVSYQVAWGLTQQPGFPKLGRLIFRDAFEAWRKALARAARRQSGQPSPKAHQPASGGKADAPAPTNDSPTPWPPRAARLRALSV